ncbi:hypothetical protein ARMSODRAFT_1008287 [Armillaria solidipes]|uniref:Uncharacterized protein n=1 Tax=Armillaria solidipes TaxID=1076256 RepID=A0A2H3B8E6_9AGAR|nr:hypothetical protein ARMSODRAFT_1008287 [Armillaria solidipes]
MLTSIKDVKTTTTLVYEPPKYQPGWHTQLGLRANIFNWYTDLERSRFPQQVLWADDVNQPRISPFGSVFRCTSAAAVNNERMQSPRSLLSFSPGNELGSEEFGGEIMAAFETRNWAEPYSEKDPPYFHTLMGFFADILRAKCPVEMDSGLILQSPAPIVPLFRLNDVPRPILTSPKNMGGIMSYMVYKGVVVYRRPVDYCTANFADGRSRFITLHKTTGWNKPSPFTLTLHDEENKTAKYGSFERCKHQEVGLFTLDVTTKNGADGVILGGFG